MFRPSGAARFGDGAKTELSLHGCPHMSLPKSFILVDQVQLVPDVVVVGYGYTAAGAASFAILVNQGAPKSNKNRCFKLCV